MREQKQVFVAFLDVKKAFDNVWHPGLMVKLLKNNVTSGISSTTGTVAQLHRSSGIQVFFGLFASSKAYVRGPYSLLFSIQFL